MASVRSVQAQTLKNWELIVVNASGQDIESVYPELTSLVTQWIDPGMALGRSAAANALLDAAKGEYAIFLDDDDWFLPDHLEKLAGCLDSNPELVAAYSDTNCISQSTSNIDSLHVIERDFDPVALQLQNYLPIHAVLFRMSQVQTVPACRFCLELNLFEDWDFWLQLVAKGSFQRVMGVSAVYSLNAQSGSGHANLDNGLRTSMLRALGERLLLRWRADDVSQLIEHDARLTDALIHERQVSKLAEKQIETYAAYLIQKDEDIQQLLGQVTQKNDDIQQLKLDLSQRIQQHDELMQANRSLQIDSQLQQTEITTLGQVRVELLKQIEEIQNSRSWRFTRPLRAPRRLWLRCKNSIFLKLCLSVVHAVKVEIRKSGWQGFAKRFPYLWRHRHIYFSVLQSRLVTAPVNVFDDKPPRLHDLRLHPDLTHVTEVIDVKVSIIIPTLNAGPEFVWTLRKLNAQRAVREIEIVIVDSGSRDKTVEVARREGAKIVEILPEEFSHSYARNLGADHASGDYVLFMVQDAYPIGNYWLYGILRYLLDHADKGLVAASCAEYSRSDSDMMYDSMINTHYRFLGCLEFDRIGEYQGDDHMSLRSRGQLSDVSCMISRTCFQKFRYRGNYAEDLDLGIRLIKSGNKVAMLAHVKVIHSHNRLAYYYLKRSFVDVVFLVGLFDDFTYPHCASLHGLLAGIEATAIHVSHWLRQLKEAGSNLPLSDYLNVWIAQARRDKLVLPPDASRIVGDERLDAFVSNMSMRYLGTGASLNTAIAQEEALRFLDTFLARLAHFCEFAAEVYGPQDNVVRHELGDVLRKTFAAATGSALAFYCLDHRHPDDSAYAVANMIHQELAAGV